jgi:hypothetical protein
MFKRRLAEWLSAVFVQWRLAWAWLGLVGTVLAVVFSAFPQVKPSWLPAITVAISGIASFLILMAASFVVWWQERDKLESLTDAAHLVLFGLPRAKAHPPYIDFVFKFRNEGKIPLERVFTFAQVLVNKSQVDQTSHQLDYLAAGQFLELPYRLMRDRPFMQSGDLQLGFRLIFEYERTELHRRCKAEDEIRFDLETQTFQLVSRRKPVEFPLPPSKWQRVWSDILQMGG